MVTPLDLLIGLFSPVIQHINKSCAPEFDIYNQCLSDHPAEKQYKCVQVLELFNTCAAHASDEYKKKVMVDQ